MGAPTESAKRHTVLSRCRFQRAAGPCVLVAERRHVVAGGASRRKRRQFTPKAPQGATERATECLSNTVPPRWGCVPVRPPDRRLTPPATAYRRSAADVTD